MRLWSRLWLRTIGHRFRGVLWGLMGSISFRFWIGLFWGMVRLELMDTWLGNLVMGMAMRNLNWVGHLHWNRDLDVFFAHFFNNFRAFLFVTVAFHNLVIILALLLKRLHTFFFWHIHCCWQALGGNSEKFQINFGQVTFRSSPCLALRDYLRSILDLVLDVTIRIVDDTALLPCLLLKAVFNTVFVVISIYLPSNTCKKCSKNGVRYKNTF